jgi:hypothetical protein
MISAADENSTGPASFRIPDPDGNTSLVDRHVQGDLSGNRNADVVDLHIKGW